MRANQFLAVCYCAYVLAWHHWDPYIDSVRMSFAHLLFFCLRNKYLLNHWLGLMRQQKGPPCGAYTYQSRNPPIFPLSMIIHPWSVKKPWIHTCCIAIRHCWIHNSRLMTLLSLPCFSLVLIAVSFLLSVVRDPVLRLIWQSKEWLASKTARDPPTAARRIAGKWMPGRKSVYYVELYV